MARETLALETVKAPKEEVLLVGVWLKLKICGWVKGDFVCWQDKALQFYIVKTDSAVYKAQQWRSRGITRKAASAQRQQSERNILSKCNFQKLPRLH